jgi:hypothetical protein
MKSPFRTAALAVAMTASLSNAISIPMTTPKNDIFKRGTSPHSIQPLNHLFLTQCSASSDLSLPADGLSTNCISVGFLPSEGDSKSPRYTMAQINGALGAKAATYGWYGQIKGSSFDGSQFLAVKDDIKKSGAVFVASVMPSVNFNQITADVAKQVAAVMKKFTDDGIPVWLRFAHEMNWYVQDGTYHGTAADFQTAWKNIYNANCKGNAKVKCFWSPNQAAAKDLTQWWPGKEYVDIVGIDCYPRAGEDTTKIAMFDKLYGDFYNTYSKANNLPFAIGETGAGNGQKDGWLKTLISTEVKAKYPNYVSMSWFEFDKEADFRVVMTSASTLTNTKKTLLAGGNQSCGKGSGTTPPPVESPQPTGTAAVPSATSTSKPSTCNWG